MRFDWTQFVAGFIIAALISWAAWKTHSLNRSGAWAATLLGAVIFGIGGLPWSVLLMAFFISSSALSRFSKKRKASLNEKFSKGSVRDAGQVLANGGVAGLFVLLTMIFPGSPILWLAFSGALAGANADTWATELGVLSKADAILITTGKTVERGTSGGVSWFGTASAFCGALLIGLFSALFWTQVTGQPITWISFILSALGVALAGLLGSLFDSFLGATLQAIYHCPTCQKETERHPLHTCGSPTTLLRGLPWLDNDFVNIGCTIVGGLLGVLAGLL